MNTETQFMALVMKIGTDRAFTLLNSVQERKSVIIGGGAKGKSARTFRSKGKAGAPLSDDSLRGRIIAYVKRKNRHPVTLMEIVQAMGASYGYVSCTLASLVSDGRLQRPARAVYMFVK